MKQIICNLLLPACILLLLSDNVFATSCASVPPEQAEAYASAQASYIFYSKVFLSLTIFLLVANLVFFLITTKQWIWLIVLTPAGILLQFIYLLVALGYNVCGEDTQYFAYEAIFLVVLLLGQIAWSTQKKKITPQDQKILSIFDE